MAEFRLTQISDTHLTRNFTKLTENFRSVSEHIDASRPDLVVNTGDVSWDGPTSRADLEFARELHAALPVDCRYLPGNHDIGDNPTAFGAGSPCPATEELRDTFVSVFSEDRWQFEAANWRFIGLNSVIMNTGIPSELEQEEWLTAQLEGARGKPIALFLHKPLFLNTPGDPEEAATAIRFVPQPDRARLVTLLGAYNVRLVASGHVHQRRDFTYAQTRHIWAPSVGFIVPDHRQDVIGVKETGLVEYRFRPESFEVRHVRAAGQINISLGELIPS
ncbi:metallophosphoesterase family protein [Bradyrhizobium erythrophlei]|jgi:3',5'-cyclic AMP phosphodiesterase CpdA|uniref:Calcineurin-like phosphoesterase n=1 Tax=Bradyrhizobium erythrophlei TaxID=1437360 RepID=A0A1M7UXI4_9BRAD|nr:metallophosphoesterase [Bradyrhizobium erythrophlei]SHN87679.1 Calcineurin-like phosphoesterase [Bradyrhizobium erythrophlei]